MKLCCSQINTLCGTCYCVVLLRGFACMQDIFKYIGRYRPGPLEQLPMRLMPFIPEYIPAVGGTDELIKVPRPDGQPDYLGLKV